MKTKLALLTAAVLITTQTAAHAHDDEERPKSNTAAAKNLAAARKALDELKLNLARRGMYSCCIKRPPNAKTEGCDICARAAAECRCAASLIQKHAACGECIGGWRNGNGAPGFGKIRAETLTVQPVLKPGAAVTVGTAAPFQNKILEAKRTLAAEKRFNCCISSGGCDECAFEAWCACAKRLAADISAPAGTPRKGVCGQCVDGQHAGIARVRPPNLEMVTFAKMDTLSVQGLFGPWKMNREAGGTSWAPDSTPMFAAMQRTGTWNTMQMGLLIGTWTQQPTARGDSQTFAATQYMAQIWNIGRTGTLGFRAMLSADPLTIRPQGYPNLLQTGELFRQMPLKDRQHPHDLFMELAAAASTPLTRSASAYLYLAPVGEPAFGPPAFQHRPTAWDNPIAPITHHWFDGTHITYGVATTGIAAQRWKIEASLFTGREPDEYRLGIDKIRMDSAAARAAWNPTPNWSLQASYAAVRSPEQLEPGTYARRTSASLLYNTQQGPNGSLALMLAWAQSAKSAHALTPASTTHAWLLETALTRGRWTTFGRFENVGKDEIPDAPPGTHNIRKLTLGTLCNWISTTKAQHGIGASLDWYSIPSSLRSAYRGTPIGINLFYRIRFGRM
jgi:hypothetical protein